MNSASVTTAKIALPDILISIYRLFHYYQLITPKRRSTTSISVQVKRAKYLLFHRRLVVT